MDRNKLNSYYDKAKKSLFLCFIFLITPNIFSQNVGVNTPNPLGVFHVDAKGDNDKNSTPTPSQQLNDFIVTSSGNIGIGTINPEAKLHIISEKNPLKIEGIPSGNIFINNILVLDEKNTVKKVQSLDGYSIPTYSLFILEFPMTNFLSNESNGQSQIIPMTMVKNEIKGLTYDKSSSTMTLPQGTYKITLLFQATHDKCNTSSYFVQFPAELTQFAQINTTINHNEFEQSSQHGNTLTYTTSLPPQKNWQIRLGRGRAGNCKGKGMTLSSNTTQVLISKLG